jgi:hypothetical protein
MKYQLVLTICLSTVLSIRAQQKTNVLIISNKEGKLLVDGNEQSWLKSSETAKLVLEDGDHIIQVKTISDIITKTVSCSDGKQKLITFDFVSTTLQPSSISDMGITKVADIQLDLPGSLSDVHSAQKFYAFDEGDDISFDFDIINKNGTVNIAVYSYPDKGLLYSKEKVVDISGEKIKIPKRGVYCFVFSTNHIINRSAHFVVNRKPISDANKNFKTSVRVKYDTTYQDVLNDQVRVYSLGNLNHPNRTIVRINLPPRTTYWVYWIGVGQESMTKMKNFADNLAKGAAGLAANPIAALGLRLIPSLPMFNSTATVSYKFADNMNSTNFNNGKPNCSFYSFKEGQNITTDYTTVRAVAKEMNLCFWNNSQFLGYDVNIKVGAFIVIPSVIPEEGL